MRISALADAGYREVCLVVAPGSGAIRDHYEGAASPTRVRLAFAVQQDPLESACSWPRRTWPTPTARSR